MKNTKVILVIIGILVLTGGLVAGLLLVQQNEDIARKAAPSTSIYVTPGTQTKSPGDTFTLSVNVDTGTNAITGVDVRLNFDPTAFQITSLTQGTGIANLNQTITNTYDNTAGTIKYAVFTLNTSNSVTGSNIEVLKVNGTVKAGASARDYNFSFDAATAASASQEGQNVITTKSQGTVRVQAGSGTGATASPTPQPTGNRTATPVATATPVPTAAPTSQSGATASPIATATSIPIPVTGTEWPTLLGLSLGVLVIIASITLAL
jgi:hypothetical protein